MRGDLVPAADEGARFATSSAWPGSAQRSTMVDRSGGDGVAELLGLGTCRWGAVSTRGCSPVLGHPQGPAELHSVAELPESLRERGGGTGPSTGCTAGDVGAALVVHVR